MKKICFSLAVIACASCIKRGPDAGGEIPFDTKRKILADKVISCFENDTPEIQYGYIENLNDGRGYTAGKAGFTSATGDLFLVVKIYSDSAPGNPLEQFLPLLQTLAASESSGTAGLEQLPAAWQSCTSDPKFCSVQDYVSDSLYYWPAVGYARELGILYPLTLLCLYDACVQQGDGDDEDGLQALIDKTNAKAGGSPADGVEEWKWLYYFNRCREKMLKHPSNAETEDEWSESTGRVDALDGLRREKNFLLDQPEIKINPFGTEHTIQL